MMRILSQDELHRYSRQLSLKNFGSESQEKLKFTKVLCIGLGGLGSPILFYLAAAGVGVLGIMDDDYVDLTNLQRQIMYTTDDIGKSKVTITLQKLSSLNPLISINPHSEKLNEENALNIIGKYDVIIDCSDNFNCRYLASDACFYLSKPYFYSSIYGFEGACSLFDDYDSFPCYRCFARVLPPEGLVPNCSENGVIGALPGVLGCIQAIEVVKYIAKIGNTMKGQVLIYDALTFSFKNLKLFKNKDCILCTNKTSFASLPYHTPFSCDLSLKHASTITPLRLKELLSDSKENFILLDVRSKHEHEISNIGGKLIPLAELPNRLNELNINQKIVIYCTSGKRSNDAAILLSKHKFNVMSLAGGLLGWKQEIEPSMIVF